MNAPLLYQALGKKGFSFAMLSVNDSKILTLRNPIWSSLLVLSAQCSLISSISVLFSFFLGSMSNMASIGFVNCDFCSF